MSKGFENGTIKYWQKNWLAKIIDGKYTGVKLSQSKAKMVATSGD